MDEKYPYGAFVWAKIPSFPWWPAKVIKPERRHLNLFQLSKLKRGQYVVAFFNDNGQFGVCADYDLQPFQNRSLHELAQTEKGPLRRRLLKAIEIAEDDLQALGHRVQDEHLPTKTNEEHDADPQHTSVTKRSCGSKSENVAKAKKKKSADSPIKVRKGKTTLGKRKSSNRKEVYSDSMQYFIVPDDEEVSVEPSNAEREYEIVFYGDDSANRCRKKTRYEEQLGGETGAENHHYSRRMSFRERPNSNIIKSEGKLCKPRAESTESITLSQHRDVQDKNHSKKQNAPKEASESIRALSSPRPPSLSEVANKSMMRDTEKAVDLSKRSRFKVLMEHLGAILESNVKQWEERLKNAKESSIIREEVLLLKTTVPALVGGQRLVLEIKIDAEVRPEASYLS